jgi:VanZ family protein
MWARRLGQASGRRRRSSATWLALAYAALVVYASLYPFWPWRWPPSMPLEGLIGLPWPHYWSSFDVDTNLLGYLPLGLLMLAAPLRSGMGLGVSLAFGLLLPPALSFGMESLQYFLPGRVPSLGDWLLNSVGAWLGCALGLVLHILGGLERWHGWRERWFVPHSAGALALLALWPVGLLFPAPVPLGLGQWLPSLRATLGELLEDTPWALYAPDVDYSVAPSLPAGLEALSIALGLLAPCLLVLSVARPGLRRVLLIAVAILVGVAVTALSTALNFGPQHAWAWRTDTTVPGMAAGALLALLAAMFSRRACAALGLIVLTALIALVSVAPADPYLAQSLQAWEQGRFINLYGLARWVGWVWPFVSLAWLLAQVARRDA